MMSILKRTALNMSKAVRSWKTVCLAAASVLLCSCVDVEEEVWLNADASGAARIQVSLPENAARLQGGEKGVRQAIEDFIDASSVFSSYSLETETENGLLKVDLAVTFDNAMDLADLKKASGSLPTGTGKMMGETSVEFSGLSLIYARKAEIGKSIPGSFLIPESKLRGHGITTIFHLPLPATTHNATSTEDGGKTLIWKTPLAVAFKQPMENQFTMPLPIPWALIAMGFALLLFLVLIVIYYFRKDRQRKATGV